VAGVGNDQAEFYKGSRRLMREDGVKKKPVPIQKMGRLLTWKTRWGNRIRKNVTRAKRSIVVFWRKNLSRGGAAGTGKRRMRVHGQMLRPVVKRGRGEQ